MNILEKIIREKVPEIKNNKSAVPEAKLELSPFYSKKTISLKNSLLKNEGLGIIAEFKRASPSKGLLHPNANPVEIAKAYQANGASGISVLTEKNFFKGSVHDFQQVRESVESLPLLRKDFIIDEYQIAEAKALGADVILIIAACLSAGRVKELSKFAKELQLEVLLEIHDEQELGHLCEYVDIAGVNNRNLKTFEVSIQNSIRLSSKIPDDFLKISESGISDIASINELKKYGFKGFLIGELFMKDKHPDKAFASFVNEMKYSINS